MDILEYISKELKRANEQILNARGGYNKATEEEERAAYSEIIDEIQAHIDELETMRAEYNEPAENRGSDFSPFKAQGFRTLESRNFDGSKNNYNEERSTKNMFENRETREFFEKFVTRSGVDGGTTSTMEDVIPETVMNSYVIENAPGAFYTDASKTQIANSGKLKLPIATLQTISAHTENTDITPGDYVPDVLEITHNEYAENCGYSQLGVSVSVSSFMKIIDDVLLRSMYKKLDAVCLAAVTSETYTDDTNAIKTTAWSLDDFASVAGLLGADFVTGAKWYMSPKTYFGIVKIKDEEGRPIFDPSKKASENAPLGFPIALDPQIADDCIYFGNGSRIHINEPQGVFVKRWEDDYKNMQMAGVRSVAGAACEAGAFVKLYKVASTEPGT